VFQFEFQFETRVDPGCCFACRYTDHHYWEVEAATEAEARRAFEEHANQFDDVIEVEITQVTPCEAMVTRE